MNIVGCRRNPANFEQIVEEFNGFINKVSYSFSRDSMLSRVESIDSLKNICRWKLYETLRDFVYNSELTEEHNERRFIALLKTYIKNALIDSQFFYNVSRRKPNSDVISTEQIDCDGEGITYEPCDCREMSPDVACILKEMIERINSNLDVESRVIFNLQVQGYDVEGIARKTGIFASRVRYIIYSRIQPVARDYVKGKKFAEANSH